MLIIGCSLALIVIYKGMKLMAQTEKENLGNMYKYVSMFLVVMGFLMIAGITCRGIMHRMHRGHETMEKNERMMECGGMDNSCMRGMGHHNMFFRHRMNMEGCCNGGMQMHGGGCEGEMNECCHEKMMGKCRGENEECDEESDECPMKKGECKKDSIVKIIKKK